MANVTKTYHHSKYDAIDARRPELSQAGKNILVVGGSIGIGLAIAEGFLNADAHTVFVTGRSQQKLDAGKAQLARENLRTIRSDVSDADDVAKLWQDLKTAGTDIDVLVLNAGTDGGHISPFKSDMQLVETEYKITVLGNLAMTRAFLAQGPATGKVILNTSTGEIHWDPMIPEAMTYSSSKMAWATLMQMLASNTPAEEVQMISIHPGAILTQATVDAGYDVDAIDWDNESLPANFYVWAATPAASFLHGRFTWANWDVDELKAVVEQNDKDFLRIGIFGVGFNDPNKLWVDIKAKSA
ncbi:hypothetical protein FH972_009485 [Carpinus fangiana]|uniref:Uncharacterized protein n=1 Tax=Carpinus fangiana TaxID=176857 RepID=A0A660KKH9_9ROSI|nr:hypothetical protein FH972_009485 [Carpinus fangiana]